MKLLYKITSFSKNLFQLIMALFIYFVFCVLGTGLFLIGLIPLMFFSSILYLLWIIKIEWHIRFKNKLNNIYFGKYFSWLDATAIYKAIQFGGWISLFIFTVYVTDDHIKNIFPDNFGYYNEEGSWITYGGLLSICINICLTYFISYKINRYLYLEESSNSN